MTYEYKAYPAKFSVLDEAEGVVEAYVNTMGAVDYASDIMAPGVFDRAVQTKGKLPYLEGIDHTGIAGKTLETRQDGNRQYVKCKFNLNTQAGHDAFFHVKDGDVEEWSVKWETLERHFEQKNGQRVRVIDKIDWVGYGPVIEGASHGTSTLSVKAAAGVAETAHTQTRSHYHEHDDGTEHTHPHQHDAGEADHDTEAHSHAVSEPAENEGKSRIDIWARHLHEQKAIAEKDGAPKSPPKGFPTDPDDYGDPKNFKYPIDEGHIRAAVSYFNHDGAREKGGYTTAEWAEIGGRIAARANKLIGTGHTYKNGTIEADAGGSKRRAARMERKDAPEGSYEDLREDLMRVLTEGMGAPFAGQVIQVVATFDDHAVVCCYSMVGGTDYWIVPYELSDDGDPVTGKPIAATVQYVPANPDETAELDLDLEEARRYVLAERKALTQTAGPRDGRLYADPLQRRYPLGPAQIGRSLSYYRQAGAEEKARYTRGEWHEIGRRIATAATDQLGAAYECLNGRITVSDGEDAETKRRQDRRTTALWTPERIADAKRRRDEKAGRRTSAADRETMQQVHDLQLKAHPEIECNPDNMPGRKGRALAELEDMSIRMRLLNLAEVAS